MAARALSTAAVSFGLVSIPVKLFTTTRSDSTIRFNQLDAHGARLKQQYVSSKTGEVVRKIDLTGLLTPGHHPRCYRNKATTQYILHGRSGVEFLDLSSDRVIADHWIRGTCQYGILPAGGLLYTPPPSARPTRRSR